MSKVHVKTGDTVVVLNGKNRGKQGKVMQVSPSEGKVIVEGVNVVTKHVKPRKVVCPKCGKPTRVGHEGTGKDKKRVCKKCGAQFE